MGYYIETRAAQGKAQWLVDNHQAQVLPNVVAARNAQDAGKGVVCVLDNGIFDIRGWPWTWPRPGS